MPIDEPGARGQSGAPRRHGRSGIPIAQQPAPLIGRPPGSPPDSPRPEPGGRGPSERADRPSRSATRASPQEREEPADRDADAPTSPIGIPAVGHRRGDEDPGPAPRTHARRRAVPVDHGGHGHGHGHSPAPPAGRRVRIFIAALLVPCAVATLVGIVLLWPSGGPPPTAQPVAQQPVHAEVTATSKADCSPGSGDGQCLGLVLKMADGPLPGRDLVQVVPVEPGSPTFTVGDPVVLGFSGGDPNDPGSYQVVDFQRGTPLVWLAAIFAGAVLLLGRWRGLAALVALALSFVVLLMFVLPAILDGHNPLAVAVVGSCLIMFVVLYLTHGPSARTSTAVLGTLLSLAVIGGLGAAFSVAARLTGLDDQTSNLIATLGTGVDARGLLLAGVVIGALGVLDDVTVTQTSAVWELRRANPELGAPGLFAAAMRIGRDHVSSAVNTLVLAYAGASLPLLLLFTLSGRALGDVVTTQDVATEVVRTLVGSIGLVASVPITTALAAVVASREADVEP
ncbi:YibE/F family protein [Pseudonocardia yunnanensis]|uniref:YibE/F family protein n=1 Tax=Pseudonocardia yunnanensis TaxID=58107 RepID=A0ABW4F3H0_9PSEU